MLRTGRIDESPGSASNRRLAVGARIAGNETPGVVEHRAPEHPSTTDAVERMLDAGQRLVTERIELARLDAEDAITHAIGRGVFVVLMGLFAFSGWWAAMAAVVMLLDAWMPLPASLALVGGVHVLVGSGAVAYALMKPKSAAGTTEAKRE